MSATLIVFKPDGSRVDVPLKGGKYLVGRSSSSRLRVPLPNVSRRHCEFIVDGSAVRLRDLHSSNGTFRNGSRCLPDDEVPLSAGDIIAIGSCQMGLQIDGQPEVIEAPKEPAPSLQTTSTPSSPPKAPPSSLDDEDTEDLDETVSKISAINTDDLLAELNDGSSEFDFNFDFEEDEKTEK